MRHVERTGWQEVRHADLKDGSAIILSLFCTATILLIAQFSHQFHHFFSGRPYVQRVSRIAISVLASAFRFATVETSHGRCRHRWRQECLAW